MAADGARTWILTGSPENDAATADHGFTVGDRRVRGRDEASSTQPGGGIVLYLTRVMRIAAALRITGELQMHAAAGVSA